MSYSIDSITEDCYEGTTCLINKFGIQDEKQLAAMEADITFAKACELEQNPVSQSFDFEHYKAIHKYLFEDIYEWAGTLRTINISKKGTNFCIADTLEAQCEKCFERLRKQNLFLNLSRDEFIEEIVEFYSVTNMLHPFREGNGRTQRIFITELIRHNGHSFNFSDIDTDELMIATIKAANGISDQLKYLFSENIRISDSESS